MLLSVLLSAFIELHVLGAKQVFSFICADVTLWNNNNDICRVCVYSSRLK